MGRAVLGGTTNASTVVRIVDSTAFTPEEGVNACTAGLNIWYRKGPLGAVTNLTEANLCAPTSAHADGGIVHLDDGYYRVDLPDAAWTTACCETCVTIGGTATGMIVIGDNHPLVAYNPGSATDLGLSSIAAILTDTGTCGVVLANCAITSAKIATGAIASGKIASAELSNIADRILNRDFASVCDSNARTLLNAARFLRNKWSISSGTLTVTKENDSTSAWTASVTTTAGDPASAVDPA